ncbi:MAG TPA: LysE family transporter [Thermodesulfobacteriota bacterium]|nr:LysE family transporter [Thermodesulfobacteriota bacterium]
MTLILFLKGVVVGLSMAVPVGPIGILCIRRTLLEGRISGFVSALGLASADVVFGCIAGFGLTFISNFLISQQFWLRLIGGLFLCGIGLKVLLSKVAERDAPSRGKGLLGAYTSMFFLTLTYPMTVLILLGVFAGLGIGNTKGDYGSIAALVLGVFTGSILWWAILSIFIGSLRNRIKTQNWQWVNKTSGTLIIGFGLAVLLSLVL